MSETAADQASAARTMTAKVDEGARRRATAVGRAANRARFDAVEEKIEAPPDPPAVPIMDGRVIEMLEEIPELAVMDDEERHCACSGSASCENARILTPFTSTRKTERFPRADDVLTQLETHFPGDSQVKQARNEHTRQRDAAEEASFKSTEERVQDLISVASWDKAVQTARGFRR